jgi:hypothetical protein
MRESNTHATKKDQIQCLEVLISKTYLNSNNNLMWTLSVYSLENKPVRKNRAIHNSEIFHFMLYDWSRTLKQLLEEHQVPYAIIQFFSPENFYSGSLDACPSTNIEMKYLSALQAIHESGGTVTSADDRLLSIDENVKADFIQG